MKIIDEFTGRILEGRRWSDGLDQAVEAKEGVRIREENQTLATITLQNYPPLRQARRDDRHGVDRGDGVREDHEVGDPDPPADDPRRPQRPDLQDQGRQAAGGRERDQGLHETGQPILVGTISVEVSEMLSAELRRSGIEHSVLNAKPENAQREGETVAQAGLGAVTIATNMAGRGVDIKLGGDPEQPRSPSCTSSAWPSATRAGTRSWWPTSSASASAARPPARR